MITDHNFEDLEKKGYTVVPDVVSIEDCDAAICQYQKWLSQFKNGAWPKTFSGIINRYNIGHMIPTSEWQFQKAVWRFGTLGLFTPTQDH